MIMIRVLGARCSVPGARSSGFGAISCQDCSAVEVLSHAEILSCQECSEKRATSQTYRECIELFRSTSSTAVMLHLEILSHSVNICMLHPKQCMSHDHQSSVVHQLLYLSDTESLMYLGQ